MKTAIHLADEIPPGVTYINRERQTVPAVFIPLKVCIHPRMARESYRMRMP